jgi:hypothetical protein
MLFLFWSIQTFCVVAGLANAALSYLNFSRGDYAAFTLSSTVAIALAIMVVRNHRQYMRMKREDREHAERVERLPIDMAFDWSRPSIAWAYQMQRLPEIELDHCLQRGICPDCAAKSLDTMLPITCRNPACGSRFNVDANGKWSRLDE